MSNTRLTQKCHPEDFITNGSAEIPSNLRGEVDYAGIFQSRLNDWFEHYYDFGIASQNKYSIGFKSLSDGRMIAAIIEPDDRLAMTASSSFFPESSAEQPTQGELFGNNLNQVNDSDWWRNNSHGAIEFQLGQKVKTQVFKGLIGENTLTKDWSIKIVGAETVKPFDSEFNTIESALTQLVEQEYMMASLYQDDSIVHDWLIDENDALPDELWASFGRAALGMPSVKLAGVYTNIEKLSEARQATLYQGVPDDPVYAKTLLDTIRTIPQKTVAKSYQLDPGIPQPSYPSLRI